MERRSPDSFAGCLLGGAVGDALGAPVESMSMLEIQNSFGAKGITRFARAFGRAGAITDDTQLTLFTSEGLLRAAAIRRETGSCDIPAVVRRAYCRWSATQGEECRENDIPFQPDGWLFLQQDLHHRRGPGTTCFTALAEDHIGTVADPINNSRGCGGLTRVAPVGLVSDDPFTLGCELAALTHGHPSAYLAAGFLAQLISEVGSGSDIGGAAQAAREKLMDWPGNTECLRAIDAAIDLARKASSVPDPLDKLGRGLAAEEALAIGLFCALTAQDFTSGVLTAVNHGGDSDATGSITGSILGTLWGASAIPESWLECLELRDVIESVASDLFRCFVEGAVGEWMVRYPAS